MYEKELNETQRTVVLRFITDVNKSGIHRFLTNGGQHSLLDLDKALSITDFLDLQKRLRNLTITYYLVDDEGKKIVNNTAFSTGTYNSAFLAFASGDLRKKRVVFTEDLQEFDDIYRDSGDLRALEQLVL